MRSSSVLARLQRTLWASIFLLASARAAAAQTEDAAGPLPSASAPQPTHCLAALKRLGPLELETLYAEATLGSAPVGSLRGCVLVLTGKRHPCLAACAVNLAWKGKEFAPDGCFINRWLGFRALSSQAVEAPSAYDGRPCLQMEYAPGTPILGNVRDEIREIAPGLYLGRLYERCPPRFLGYFALEAVSCRHP